MNETMHRQVFFFIYEVTIIHELIQCIIGCIINTLKHSHNALHLLLKNCPFYIYTLYNLHFFGILVSAKFC